MIVEVVIQKLKAEDVGQRRDAMTGHECNKVLCEILLVFPNEARIIGGVNEVSLTEKEEINMLYRSPQCGVIASTENRRVEGTVVRLFSNALVQHNIDN